MHRYFIKLSYCGTNYNGWQVQENTPKTIQEVLTKNVSGLLNEELSIVGCGRTDTGVHAKEFYAHFDSGKDDLHVAPSVWLYKMNCVLPNDIVIHEVIPVKADASARFSALERTYQYVINRKRDPFLIDRAYSLYVPLDIDKMNKASQILLEYTDFSSFSKTNTQVKNNECRIVRAGWEEKGDLFIFTITANRFLRNMVRAIVGTLIDVGKGVTSEEELRKIIEGKNRSDAGSSVPAGGLYLTKVIYPPDIFIS